MTLSDHQWLFLQDLAKLIQWVVDTKPDWKVTGGELWRTHEQAELYYARGIGIVDSKHTYRLACDLNLFIKGNYRIDSESY